MNQNSQAATVSSWSPQRTRVLSCLKITGVLLTNSGLFPSGGAFRWSDGEPHLLEVTAWFSAKELLVQDSLMIPPYTQHRLLWTQTTLWSGWWWFPPCAHDLSHSTLVPNINGSSLPHQFILELEGFPYVSVENWVWKCNQEGETFLPA